ncbi:AAA family ATPase, partial [Rhodococcus hoagii]|nr:AAA family ATPase [Prescottella equi]
MTATIYAFCNQKGGVGKTTVTFHIADAARRAGLKVLAVDMDPQGNLSTILTKEPIHPGDAGHRRRTQRPIRGPLGDIISEDSGPASNSPAQPSPTPRPSPQ